MASTPERKVKTQVVKVLKERGVYHFPPMMGGYGSAGIPDIVACVGGKFLGIECKAGPGRPTELQKKNLRDIVESGGFAIVVNDGELFECPVPLIHYKELPGLLDSLISPACNNVTPHKNLRNFFEIL